ncbi:hypothetical protein [Polymorphobacter megasporae]|uniref:hypothetical protein n=1 Tax=Glacieibacterium megasporae TaxID=2835787 RepID=UPI001C1E8961|nr:hypothetical protein [Polymorphobacter megasporae]UAJ12772.1 hypothetical protein KTC28_19710 [Polymorphobacter megasporae]
MARYSFQVRTGDATHLNGGEAEFGDITDAIAIGRFTLARHKLRHADHALKLSGSVLEIVDEDGDVVASLPIGALTRH